MMKAARLHEFHFQNTGRSIYSLAQNEIVYIFRVCVCVCASYIRVTSMILVSCNIRVLCVVHVVLLPHALYSYYYYI